MSVGRHESIFGRLPHRDLGPKYVDLGVGAHTLLKKREERPNTPSTRYLCQIQRQDDFEIAQSEQQWRLCTNIGTLLSVSDVPMGGHQRCT